MSFGWIVLLLLLVVLWQRDKSRNTSGAKNRNEVLSAEASRGEPKEEELLVEEGNENPASFLDEEFLRKHPCEFMHPYVLPNGKRTYVCTNREAWKRWGVEEEIDRNLNEGFREQCARCLGIPCRGERRK